MKNVNIHIMKNSPRLLRHQAYLRRLIRSQLRKIDAKLNLKNVDIVVIDGLDYMQPEQEGLTALNYYDNQVFLMFDTRQRTFPNTLNKQRLLNLFSHELHHVIRQRTAKDETLFEMAITEGLAVYFSHELAAGRRDPQWMDVKKMYPKINVKKLLQRALPKLNDKSFEYRDYLDWMYGSKKLGLPRSGGYALGCALVKKYLDNHPKKRPSQLHALPAKSFRPYIAKVFD